MNALVDTVIRVDLLRGCQPAVDWRDVNKGLLLGITPFVWLEVVNGAPDKARQRIALRFLSYFSLVYLVADDQEWSMRQFQRFHLSHDIGVADCLIAVPSHRLQLPLYTRNLKHFAPLLGKLVQTPYSF